MEKLKMHSANLTQDNIARIRDLFPSCVTEARGEDGSIKLAVDFDQLRQELSDSTVEGPQERYQLNWPGKREALLMANAPIAKTLRPCREESVDFDVTRNLFIEGDNLEALKLLQETYLGKVKVIYIDPPYNTGNDFIYNDDFSEGSEEFLRRSQQKDDVGTRLVANTEGNGRFHSNWLSMIYPRIKLAKSLLRDDGFIFISIDDNEFHNLRQVCDEIFGQDQFVGAISIENNPKGRKNSKFVSVSSEYLLVYAKCKADEGAFFVENIPKDPNSIKTDSLGVKYTPGKRVLVGECSNPPVSSLDSKKHYSVYWNSSTNDLIVKKEGAPSQIDESLLTEGYVRYASIKNNEFLENTYTQDELERIHGENGLIFKEKSIYEKDFNCFVRIKSIVINNVEKGIDLKTETAPNSMTPSIRHYFDHPKNIGLLRLLLTLIPEGDDIVMDFFAGSATTAHAVMQLNAEDGANRRFIMVQLPELCGKNSAATRAGFKIISDLSKERIRLAGANIRAQYPSTRLPVDIGFRVLKIDSSNMADVYYKPDMLERSSIEMFIDNIKPDRSPEDLLFQVMLDWGVDLALPIAKQTIQGKEVILVDGNALAACFDGHGGVDEAFVKELAKVQPLRVVFRDAGFKDSSVKINVEQIFKLLSPATEVKCI